MSGDRKVVVRHEHHASGFSIDFHSHHDFDQVLFALSGHIRVSTGRAVWIVPPGSGIFVPSETIHNLAIPRPSDVRAVNVMHSGNETPANRECCLIKTSPLLGALVEEVATFPEHTPLSPEQQRMEAVLLDCLSAAPRDQFFLPIPSDKRARLIVDMMMKNPGAMPDLDTFSVEAGASRRTIVRLFISETGMDFRTYRQRLQLHMALPMLLEGQAIAEVAFAVGYESTSAFIHAFKKVLGVTPARFSSWSLLTKT
jgi:AraC-like DNA-binding protein